LYALTPQAVVRLRGALLRQRDHWVRRWRRRWNQIAQLAIAVFALLAFAECGGTAHRETTPPAPASTRAPETGNVQQGLATFYGDEQGTQTASGERFDKRKLTAAHRSLPFGTRVRVTNTRNGKSVEVRINDRGPFGNRSRIIDLTVAAARQLDMIKAGVVPVTIEVLH
jgi:rare lipoprotein A